MATTNRLLTGVETIVLSPGTERAHISSTLVRQIAGLGGDVSGFVPPPVLEALRRSVSADDFVSRTTPTASKDESFVSQVLGGVIGGRSGS